MSSLASISIKQQDGTYKYYTLSILDEPNKYGNNIEVYEPQSIEEIKDKAKKNYLGSGNVFWTDGNIKSHKRQKQ